MSEFEKWCQEKFGHTPYRYTTSDGEVFYGYPWQDKWEGWNAELVIAETLAECQRDLIHRLREEEKR